MWERPLSLWTQRCEMRTVLWKVSEETMEVAKRANSQAEHVNVIPNIRQVFSSLVLLCTPRTAFEAPTQLRETYGKWKIVIQTGLSVDMLSFGARSIGCISRGQSLQLPLADHRGSEKQQQQLKKAVTEASQTQSVSSHLSQLCGCNLNWLQATCTSTLHA